MTIDRTETKPMGEALRLLREVRLGPRSLRKLARELGQHHSYLSSCERGEAGISDRLVLGYERVLSLRDGAVLEVAAALARGEAVELDRYFIEDTGDTQAVSPAEAETVAREKVTEPVEAVGRLFITLSPQYGDHGEWTDLLEATFRLELDHVGDGATPGFGLIGSPFVGASFESDIEPIRRVIDGSIMAEILCVDPELLGLVHQEGWCLECKVIQASQLLVFQPSWMRIDLLRIDFDVYAKYELDSFQLNELNSTIESLASRVADGPGSPSAVERRELERGQHIIEFLDLDSQHVYGMSWAELDDINQRLL